MFPLSAVSGYFHGKDPENSATVSGRLAEAAADCRLFPDFYDTILYRVF